MYTHRHHILSRVAVLLVGVFPGASRTAFAQQRAEQRPQVSVQPKPDACRADTARHGKNGHAVAIDQRFLRSLANYEEGLRTLAHGRMMQPSGHAAHGEQNDPAKLDGQFDGLQQEVLTLLTCAYQDAYSPVALTPDGARANRDTAAVSHAESQVQMASQLRHGIELIDSFHGKLRRPDVRALATKQRALLAVWLSTVPPSK